MTAGLRFGLCSLVLLAGTPGCGGAGPAAEITARRTASKPSSRVVPGATPRQRFGEQESEARQGASDDLIDYDLPDGWMAIAPTSDRLVNLRPAGDPEAECYLSFLQGSGGGLEANVNRWRAQLGAEPLAGSEIQALLTVPMLGRDATLVEVEGAFKGMGGVPARAGFKLLGLVVAEPSGSLFLKFTAPAGLVELERERFLEFARSLRLAEVEGDPDAGHFEGDGHDHGAAAAPGASGAGRATPAGPLAWQVPPGWIEGPRRGTRDVTFAFAEGAECYVMRLAGDAGGLRANLDRWCAQVGREVLSDEAFAALERVEVLGQEVPLLALEGDFTGMDGGTRAGHGLLGVACIRPGESVFVKLTGPEALVRAEHANFLAFVRSLEEAP